jgi:two-component system CheB/CheR fusion protein
MVAVGTTTLAEYRRYVERHPEEMQCLVTSFLIKVTRFFRDPNLFTYLRDHVLPSLIAEARERGELRLWSAGCATGEEAYTLAMLVTDLLGDASAAAVATSRRRVRSRERNRGRGKSPGIQRRSACGHPS